jgi:fucose permease
MYGLFAVLSFCMLILITVMRLPKIELADNEKAGALLLHWELLKNKHVRLFFIAIIAYVATEQGVANSLSLFLQKYHGFDPETVGAEVVSKFWMLMTIGCFVGLGLL